MRDTRDGSRHGQVVGEAVVGEGGGGASAGVRGRHPAGLSEGWGLPSIWQVAASTRALFAVAATLSLMPKFVLLKTATLRVPVASV
ncbi:hypothetical protein IGW14_16715 [Streptomyces hygroscopicus subsp. hygroscopicus]|nr:hypothetical protein [Streptomyces hygroscopicus subsp. hygroscopicus]